MLSSPSISLNSLAAALRSLDQLLEQEYRSMSAAGRLQDHPARGLFLDPTHVRKLLQPNPQIREAKVWGVEEWPAMAHLQKSFSLSSVECWVLLLAIAPQVDPRYESIYGYLHNDVTRKQPSIELASRLFLAAEIAGPEAWQCFHVSRPLLRERLIALSDGAFASRTFSSDPGLAAFLAGSHSEELGLLDGRLPGSARWIALAEPNPLPFDDAHVEAWLAATAALAEEGGTLLLRGRSGAGKRQIATHLSHLLGRPLLAANVEPTSTVDSFPLIRREARIRQANVYLSLPPDFSLAAVTEAFADSGLTVLCGRKGRHEDDRLASYNFEIPSLSVACQGRLWKYELGLAEEGIESELAEVASKFSLTPGQISAAARDAMRQSRMHKRTIPISEDLHRAARAQAGAGLLRLATRVELCHGWDDLVLPPHILTQLSDIRAQVRNRERVYTGWDFASRFGPARGIAVLFAGPSGTGKTMSASVLARDLGLELYRVDLATVVSKYIGETEKNLSLIFGEAEDSNAILFFDEADALFGKRSEVKDAHDRYANLEVAYLLQRVESYSGIAILATNLSGNLDEAFARRMAHIVEFISPDTAQREVLWRKCLPPSAPLDRSVDFGSLAHQFQISGGNIRNIALSAAFSACEQGEVIGMRHLIRATARELEKIGRQPSRAEFSDFYPLVEQRQ